MKLSWLKLLQQGTLIFALVTLAACGGSDSSTSDVETFSSASSGSQEVPSNASTATGTGSVSFDPSTRRMHASVTTSGITGTVAHIHEGAIGVSGPIIFALSETFAGSGIWTTDVVITEAQAATLRAGAYYFNVHSGAFPAGEIRGQILPLARQFSSALNGLQEVPPNASAATGTGSVSFDPSTRRMQASVTTSGITGTVAHIHAGAIGVSGPIIFPLSETFAGSGIWTTDVVITEAQAATLRAGNYYFNVHSAAIPTGEIRGQILAVTP